MLKIVPAPPHSASHPYVPENLMAQACKSRSQAFIKEWTR